MFHNMPNQQADVDQLNKSTVRVKTEESTGTGIVVSDSGLILTCFHVIGDVKHNTLFQDIEVYFPMAEKTSKARVIKEYCRADLDIAFLQDEEELPEQTAIAPLDEKIVNGHDFVSIGFRKAHQFEKPLGAFGKIQIITSLKSNNADEQSTESYVPSLIQLYSDQIEEGMSGAAVLDVQSKKVIGIVNLHHPAKDTTVDTRLNFAIPISSVLENSKGASLLRQKNPGLFMITKFLEEIRLVGKGKNYQSIDSLFVPPTEYDAIRDALRTNHIVFVTGPPEYGKTYTAIRLLWEYFNSDPGYTPVYFPWVQGTNDVAKKLIAIEDTLEPRHIYYYEDPFGKYGMYERNEELERSISHIIDIVKDSDDVYVIITSKEDIFKDFQGRNMEIKKFEQKLNLKTPSYNHNKRKEMLLKRAAALNSVWLKDDDTRNAILKTLGDKTMLPTPLNIKNFVHAIQKEKDKHKILDIMKKKSELTAESFGKEIEDMIPKHPDRMIFLSFPFISDGFSVEFVEAEYEELVKNLKKELNIENPWRFDALSNRLEDKIEIKDGNLRFSHPSYSEAIKYIISEDRFTTKAAEILGKVLVKVVDSKYYDYNLAIVRIIADNFIHMSAEAQNLFFELADDSALVWIMSMSLISNFRKLPDEPRKLIFKLLDKNGYAVASAITNNFDKLPEEVRNELLLRLADKPWPTTASAIVGIITNNFHKLSESVRNELLLRLANSSYASSELAQTLASNFEELSEDVRNKLLIKLAADGTAASTVAGIVVSNFNRLSDGEKNLVFKLASSSFAVALAAATGYYFDNLPENVRNELLLKLASGDYEVAYEVANIVNSNFNEMNDNVRNELLLTLADTPSGAHEVANIVNSNFNEMNDNVRNELLLTLATANHGAVALANIIVSNFYRLPDYVTNLLLIFVDSSYGATTDTAIAVAIAVHSNFKGLPSDTRNKLLLKLADKESAVTYVIQDIVSNLDILPENVRNELLPKLAIGPSHVNALKSEGNALLILEEYTEALEWYDKALAIDPTNADALGNKGNSFNGLGKYEQAIEWYDKALAIDPNDADILANKGYSLYMLGKYEQAIEWYDKALAIDPSHVNALNGKGNALSNLEEYTEAIEWYDKALAIDPYCVEALNNKKAAANKLKM